MKVAHFAQFGPNRAGMYATVKDLILAERQVGIDAVFIDSALPCKECGYYEIRVGKTDGELVTASPNEAYDADILVRHTTIPKTFENLGKPMILCLHGRPENTFTLERMGKMPIYSFMEQVAHDQRYKAFVTFWEEFTPLWDLLLPANKLHFVPAPVNLDEFTPVGDSFNFGARAGSPNILVADMWREDDTPFNLLMAAAVFKRLYCPTAKVHVCGIPAEKIGAIPTLARILDNIGVWGQAFTLSDKMPDIYRGADFLITPHIIATRVIREACASGLPFVAGPGCQYTKFQANPKDYQGFAKEMKRLWDALQNESAINQMNGRDIANKQFSMKKAGQAMANLFENVIRKYRVIPKPPTMCPPIESRRVFIDLGSHVGESILQFYHDVDLANQYQIFGFEPLPEAFEMLQQNTARLENVNLINAAAGTEEGIAQFFAGQSNHGDGSTLLPGKLTGGVDYAQPVDVTVIEFCHWLDENTFDSDYIVLKMNIEGGEFPLLSHMLGHSILFERISKLYVQFHSDKFNNPDWYKREENKLINWIQQSYPNCQVEVNYQGIFTYRGVL
jgi:FkbM family methyltransferase